MISNAEVLMRLLLAVVLSGLVGIERSVKGREAGFRTHILVCLGSTLIMLTGIYLFDQYREVAQFDPTRLGSQVVTGIGFIGAGTIIQFRDSVRGLTTAASIWASAGIGLAVGSGFYVGACGATVIVLVALMILSRVEKRVESVPKGVGFPWSHKRGQGNPPPK